jgi:hypothetical protein
MKRTFFLLIVVFLILSCEDNNLDSNNSSNNNINNTNNNSCLPFDNNYIPGRVAVFTGNQDNGAISIINLDNDPYTIENDLVVVHSDSLGRYFGDIFVVNRLGADNVVSIDSSTLNINGQISTGAGTNPQDFVFINSCKGYVSLYQTDYISIINSSFTLDSTESGRISLSEYSDADGSPEASFIYFDGEKVYVEIQNLENYVAVGPGKIIVINPETDLIEKHIQLISPNPATPVVNVPDSTLLVVGTVNNYSGTGGGIEVFSPTDSTSTLAVTSENLGGVTSEIIFTEGQCGYVLVLTTTYETGIKGFCLDGTVSGDWIVAPGTYSITGLVAINEDEILFSDIDSVNPGVRVLDTATGSSTELLKTTLPPAFTKPFVLLP